MKENVYKYLESLAQLGNNFCHSNNPECIKCPMTQGCKYRVSQQVEKRGFFRK
jgi:adenine-specific DNA glycosylase